MITDTYDTATSSKYDDIRTPQIQKNHTKSCPSVSSTDSFHSPSKNNATAWYLYSSLPLLSPWVSDADVTSKIQNMSVWQLHGTDKVGTKDLRTKEQLLGGPW